MDLKTPSSLPKCPKFSTDQHLGFCFDPLPSFGPMSQSLLFFKASLSEFYGDAGILDKELHSNKDTTELNKLRAKIAWMCGRKLQIEFEIK